MQKKTNNSLWNSLTLLVISVCRRFIEAWCPPTRCTPSTWSASWLSSGTPAMKNWSRTTSTDRGWLVRRACWSAERLRHKTVALISSLEVSGRPLWKNQKKIRQGGATQQRVSEKTWVIPVAYRRWRKRTPESCFPRNKSNICLTSILVYHTTQKKDGYSLIF